MNDRRREHLVKFYSILEEFKKRIGGDPNIWRLTRRTWTDLGSPVRRLFQLAQVL